MVGAQKSYNGVSSKTDTSASVTDHIPIRTDGPGIMIRGTVISHADEARYSSGSADDVVMLLKNDIVSKHAQTHIVARVCDEIAGNGAGVPFTAPERYAVAEALAENPSFSDTGLQRKLINKYIFHSDIMINLVKNPVFTDDELMHTIVKAQTTDPKVIDEMLMHKKVDEQTENEIARSSALMLSTCYYLSTRPMHISTREILKSKNNPFRGAWLDNVQIKDDSVGIAIQRDDSDNVGISRVLPAA